MLLMPLNSTTTKTKRRWLKTGIQFVDGKACESVIATDEWLNWSLNHVGEDADTAE
jgi:regulation of enolase protein 1 (concanavalin A-like superfamily)